MLRHRAIVAFAAIAVLTGIGFLTMRATAQPEESQREAPSRSERLQEFLSENFDLSNPQVDLSEILGPFVPVDGIPPIDDPDRVAAASATYPEPDGRVVAVEINGEAVAYPIGILTYHEIVNDEVGGVPVAVTYCPLCDSAAVADRRFKSEDGETMTLRFGVSGVLLNSNVVMWEKNTRGLWSQVAMRAITGPHAGRSLTYLPIRMMSLQEFQSRHPRGEVMTTNTGHRRDYTMNPYEERGYFDDKESVPAQFAFEYDERLAPKTLGLGIFADGEAIFVQADHLMGKERTIETPLGPIRATATEAGIEVLEAPTKALTMQTFYHSWSAFHSRSEIIPPPSTSKAGGGSD